MSYSFRERGAGGEEGINGSGRIQRYPVLKTFTAELKLKLQVARPVHSCPLPPSTMVGCMEVSTTAWGDMAMAQTMAQAGRGRGMVRTTIWRGPTGKEVYEQGK
ncbi:uncharacterized protein L203_102573 [Cryptococcus depauperatus CBS 7841]|uniref:Uncharacterized protein n=1 Tax=Cryptococcus depauperatus CBS 7841 TaxID=1295531 RepID=A0A1E3IDW2_9TREE|nr:hypothetical protein L203_03936 [Cryptococcus depauperatus CBS 7841]